MALLSTGDGKTVPERQEATVIDPLELKVRLLEKQTVQNQTFPMDGTCAGCGNKFTRKTLDHQHCSEKCRWKKCIKENRPSAQRARDRSKAWYRENKERHKANVKRRKQARAADSSLPLTPLSDIVNASTVESATSERLRKS
jgi:hypothetical protein